MMLDARRERDGTEFREELRDRLVREATGDQLHAFPVDDQACLRICAEKIERLPWNRVPGHGKGKYPWNDLADALAVEAKGLIPRQGVDCGGGDLFMGVGVDR